jgi:DNA-binding MurR/RpiR family transcriptional regulator
VRFLADSAEQGAAAAFLEAGDCLLAISFSGRTRATVDAAERAARGGASVIVLSCNRHGPLLRHATVRLVIDARSHRIDSEWPMRTAMLAVTRALTLYVADEFSQDELGLRRSTWASGRFGMRYDDV